MRSSHRLAMAALVFTGAVGGCALVGYDFDGYVGDGGGGGQARTSSPSAGGAGAVTAPSASSTASSGSGSGGGGGSSSGDCSTDMCQQDHACADAPPPGWNGPVALYFSDDTSFVCPAPFDTEVLHGGALPMGPPAACSPCDCG